MAHCILSQFCFGTDSNANPCLPHTVFYAQTHLLDILGSNWVAASHYGPLGSSRRRVHAVAECSCQQHTPKTLPQYYTGHKFKPQGNLSARPESGQKWLARGGAPIFSFRRRDPDKRRGATRGVSGEQHADAGRRDSCNPSVSARRFPSRSLGTRGNEVECEERTTT